MIIIRFLKVWINDKWVMKVELIIIIIRLWKFGLMIIINGF